MYLVLGVNTEGYRDILGFYIYPQESASVWDDIFKDLKSRGLER
ncbi:IS256 family transposase, partial [bacterium]|nr:IS256 family transposase [bacterium]